MADIRDSIRTKALELGFDASLASNKVNIDFTYYKKTSKDALISRTLLGDRAYERVRRWRPERNSISQRVTTDETRTPAPKVPVH